MSPWTDLMPCTRVRLSRTRLGTALWFCLLVSALATCLPASPNEQKLVEVQVSGSTQWTDTGIDLKKGDTLKIEASGSIQLLYSPSNGPEGQIRGWLDVLRTLPLNDVGRGALIGRIGNDGAARPFLIGARRESRMSTQGRLFLGLNKAENEKADGAFKVQITRIASQEKQPDSPAINSMPQLTQAMLDQIPLRVVDLEGNAGDRTNFIIVGSEEQMRGALESAGWVKVDSSVKDTILRGALATLSKQAYVTLPMSHLMLFGRIQDYGFAQADPVRVVSARHHFRIWKAPFTLTGRTVWAGAGTHDIGIERDQRNGKPTHKIDPQVDLERDYIGKGLQETGQVAGVEYMIPANPVKEAKTASGGEFVSDGRTLVIYLQPESGITASLFADTFCSVLRQNNPDGGEWGSCSQYLEAPGREDLPIGPLSSNYRILIVPGFLSSCFADSPAFLEGQNDLRDKYGLTVEFLPVPNDGSESNRKIIAQYLNEHAKTDARKYIVVGYSKGTPDLQEALAKEPGASAAVAAFISVAGASGGSPIADALPAQADNWVKLFKTNQCRGDISSGFKSLRQNVRRAFLSSYPDPAVPTFSIAAVSDKTNTSKALLQLWQMLSAFDRELDGQISKQDAIIPGSTFVGTVRADHFAVALPFDKSPDSSIRLAMDHTRFPRAALLESLLRVVIQDLESMKHNY